MKPMLCLDFDGVIHSYKSGWRGGDIIPDQPVKGAIEFLTIAVERFTVVIFSSRSNMPNGIEAMKHWLRYFGIKDTVLKEIGFPTEKPPAMVTLDDRTITFTGVWPSLDELIKFKPWYK